MKDIDNFEITNCDDPNCYICVTMPKGGYPSESQKENGRIKLSAYHQQYMDRGLEMLIRWVGNRK